MERGESKARIVGLLMSVLPSLFWAGNFIVGRAMRGEVPPMMLSLCRWVIAIVFLLPFAWRPMRRDAALYWRHRWLLVRVTLAGVVAFNSLVYVGLQWTTAANGLLLNSFIPILIVLLGAVFYRQRLNVWQMGGLILSFSGVLTIILHGDWSRLARLEFSGGDLVVFCAMVSWAFYTLWLRAVPPQIDRIGLMGAQILLAIPVLVVLGAIENGLGFSATWSTQSLAALAYLGIFPSVLAYLFYNIGVARIGAVRAGMFIHLIPVFGVVLAWAFLHETVQIYHGLGMAAILSGLWLASREPAPARAGALGS